MKIALVVHDYHQEGGHSRYTAELAERFCLQHEVHVFTNTVRGRKAEHIHFHHVPAWRASALASIFTFIPPASMMVRSEYDIVHAQGVCMTACDVMTVHICNRAWYEHRRQLKDVTWRDRLFDSLVSPLEQWSLRGQRPWVIAISGRVERDIAQYYGRRGQISLVYHGVDIERFRSVTPAHRQRLRSRFGFSEHDVVFLFVGDLRKGAKPAIEAIAEAGRPSMLALVSRSDPEPYRRAALAAGCLPQIRFFPPSGQIEEFYAAVDGFLFPTPYDAFGMVISEAMASSLPVITSREAGAAELVGHGDSGFLLPSAFDSAAASVFVKQLATNPQLRIEMGRTARQRIETQTWDLVAEQTMAIYQQVLQRKHSDRP